MKILEVTPDKLPIIVKYGEKEYILKTTPKGLILIKKEY
jgi:hypothetical protein